MPPPPCPAPLLPSSPFSSAHPSVQVLRRVEEIEARPAGGSAPADVVVVGAGYAGVELASTVAERLGTRAAVQLVSAGSPPLLPPSLLPLARLTCLFPSHFMAVLSDFLLVFVFDICIPFLYELCPWVTLALGSLNHCHVWREQQLACLTCKAHRIAIVCWCEGSVMMQQAMCVAQWYGGVLHPPGPQ